jgi:hypothetical protein
MPGCDRPLTKRRIPERRDSQSHRFENPKTSEKLSSKRVSEALFLNAIDEMFFHFAYTFVTVAEILFPQWSRL